MLTPDQPVLGQKYRLIRQLEAGGMGSVWLAEHIHLSSLVAVKLIAREVAATPVGRERFLREARMAASLRSPNVVQILDYGLHDDMPFIAMELLEGESLAARLDREGRFVSWERAERVLRQVARAVARAHAAGIIHRDLKPANIFLVRDDEEEVVKLLDFGIAKTTAAPLSASPGSNTRTGEFLGSPAYASPEQLQVSKTLDHRADIWSLGVIAYECLIGRAPFRDETLVGLVLAICMDAPPVPSRHGSVPPGFDAWFARACARDPEQRFATVREASHELRRLIAAACGSSLPSSEPERASAAELERVPTSLPESVPAVQTPPSAPATLLQEALAAAAPAGGDTVVLRRAAGTRAGVGAARPEPAPRRSRAPLIAGLALLAVVPLLLFAIRALASRALLDSSVLGLGPSRPSETAPSDVAPVPNSVLSDVAATSVAPASSGVPALAAPLGAAPAAAEAGSPSAAPSAALPPTSVPAPEPGLLPANPQPELSPAAPASPAAGRSEKPKKPAARAALPRTRQAWLTITASAPSTVLLDGAAIGTTPLEDVAIEAGAHEITFVRDGQRNAETVQLRPGEHKRVDASPPAVRGDGLDEASVQRTLRRYSSAVRDVCWQPFSAQLPGDTSVRVVATISVEPSGRVRSVSTSGAPATYGELSRCIEERVGSWRFPSAPAGTVVNVPFVFVTE